MKSEHKRKFVEILNTMAAVYGIRMDDAQIRIWWKLLEPVTIAEFESAAMEYMRSDAAYMPRPGQMLAMISEHDGRPTPEEAWAMVHFDELDTLVLTDEAMTAYWPAYELRDNPIHARMAFLEVYRREIKNARQLHKPIHWQISAGHDPQLRIQRVREAVELGRLPGRILADYLRMFPPASRSGDSQLRPVRDALPPSDGR